MSNRVKKQFERNLWADFLLIYRFKYESFQNIQKYGNIFTHETLPIFKFITLIWFFPLPLRLFWTLNYHQEPLLGHFSILKIAHLKGNTKTIYSPISNFQLQFSIKAHLFCYVIISVARAATGKGKLCTYLCFKLPVLKLVNFFWPLWQVQATGTCIGWVLGTNTGFIHFNILPAACHLSPVLPVHRSQVKNYHLCDRPKHRHRQLPFTTLVNMITFSPLFISATDKSPSIDWSKSTAVVACCLFLCLIKWCTQNVDKRKNSPLF